MKKVRTLSILVLMAVILIYSCGQSRQPERNGSYTLRGSFNGLPEGVVKISSYNEDDRSSATIDSCSFKGGVFELKGRIDEPQMVTVTVDPGNWSFQLFLEDTVLELSADTTGAEYYDYTMYGSTKGARIKHFTETGSRNFDVWTDYQNHPFQKKFDPVFDSLNNKIKTSTNIDEQYRYRDQIDSIRKLLNEWRKEQIAGYIDTFPSSVMGAYLLRDLYRWYSDLPFEDMEKMVAAFTGDAKKSKYYSSLDAILAQRRAVMPGSVAPDFTLMKRDSSSFTLSSLRGKYIMLDFWASWCHPCRQAIPHWKQVYQKYRSKDFEIVSVSDDSKWSEWIKAMDQEKMPWLQVIDEFPVKNMPARVGSLYMTHYIPFYVLLDKEGKIILYNASEEEMDGRLEQLLLQKS